MRNCMTVGNAVAGVLCADGHLGYAQPIGGVIAYEGQISISGVGFDIACGNMAVRLDAPYAAIKDRVGEILPTSRTSISFGVGRVNEERVEHELFDDAEAWDAADLEDYARRRAPSSARSARGNHYVDLSRTRRAWSGSACTSARAASGTRSRPLPEGRRRQGRHERAAGRGRRG